jgi:hypothetical protein
MSKLYAWSTCIRHTHTLSSQIYVLRTCVRHIFCCQNLKFLGLVLETPSPQLYILRTSVRHTLCRHNFVSRTCIRHTHTQCHHNFMSRGLVLDTPYIVTILPFAGRLACSTAVSLTDCKICEVRDCVHFKGKTQSQN